jgi:hypothetical protein
LPLDSAYIRQSQWLDLAEIPNLEVVEYSLESLIEELDSDTH